MILLLLPLGHAGDALEDYDTEEIHQAQTSEPAKAAEKVKERASQVDALVRYAADRDAMLRKLLDDPACRPPVMWPLPALGEYEQSQKDSLLPDCLQRCDCLVESDSTEETDAEVGP